MERIRSHLGGDTVRLTTTYRAGVDYSALPPHLQQAGALPFHHRTTSAAYPDPVVGVDFQAGRGAGRCWVGEQHATSGYRRTGVGDHRRVLNGLRGKSFAQMDPPHHAFGCV